MTEKRFILNEGVANFSDTVTDKIYSEYNLDEIVDKLNELHEKKEILEVQLKSATNEIDKLMSEIDMLTDTCHDCCKEIREENKELKQLIKKVIDERVVDYPLLCELKKMVKE